MFAMAGNSLDLFAMVGELLRAASNVQLIFRTGIKLVSKKWRGWIHSVILVRK